MPADMMLKKHFRDLH